MRQAEDAIQNLAIKGRPSGSSGGRSPHEEVVTQGTGPSGGRPGGRPARIEPGDDQTTQRSIHRENETAVHLARRGFRITQRPSAEEVAHSRQVTGDLGDPIKRPDYLIEGRVFDCYSPEPGTSVRNVWTQTKSKIVRLQTERVVVDLQGWNGDMSSLQRQFDEWPIDRLKEVKAITPDGAIIQIVPSPRSTGGVADGS